MSEGSGAQIAPKVFVALVRAADRNKTEIGEINGELGERIKHHQENSNLNAKAFRIITAMHRMDELKRKAFWDALELYHDYASSDLWGDGHVGNLVTMAEVEPDPDEAATEANTAALRAGINELEQERRADDPVPVEAKRAATRKPPKPAGEAPGTFRVVQ
jgi:hypothetical protein